MGTTNSKLPRVRNADRPRRDETVRKRDGVDLQNGWLARHGTLYLCDDRAVFVPTILDTALGAKRREFPLNDIECIERQPKSPDEILPGARRPRMVLHTAECAYEFLMPDLDAWIDAFQIVFAHRARNGKPHMPEFVREGSTTQLLMEL